MITDAALPRYSPLEMSSSDYVTAGLPRHSGTDNATQRLLLVPTRAIATAVLESLALP